ncbi:MAG: hypothetical protein ACNYZG_11355 [Gammaproteobacteria bacterium]
MNRRELLSPLINSTNYSSFTVLLMATLTCALRATTMYAEIHCCPVNYERHELATTTCDTL